MPFIEVKIFKRWDKTIERQNYFG